MAMPAEIADAVVAALNGHAFSRPFVATRVYRPVFDLKDLDDLRVTVVPKGVEWTTAGRGLTQCDVQIDVGVQKRLASADPPDRQAGNAEIDALMTLVREIAKFVRATGRFGDAAWVKTENTPIYSQEHLSELRQFTSVLTLTLRVMTA